MVKRIAAAVHRGEGVAVLDPLDEAVLVRQRQVACGIGENHHVDLVCFKIRRADFLKAFLDAGIELGLQIFDLRVHLRRPFRQLGVVLFHVGFVLGLRLVAGVRREIFRLVRLARNLDVGLPREILTVN